ncbi:recombinase family protein [Dehalobacter sp.]|uniref:recombinase family protein n=1 Tax=Dehalobacter sp. TaxID=1962289 RepID=UPI002583DBEA|nr:recombinase family protein [Dehalobacter sp.]MDJ0304440.1 recombinase family protein [Dehalobacter sp.]
MNRSGKKCVLYPRVSTEMQVDGYSLDGQKSSLTRFADREEMEIVSIYEDAGKSGKSIEGRPAFKQMLFDIENGLEIDYILVYKLSRFGRNAADILNSLEHVQAFGVNLICIEEGIDSSQTSGKLLISVLSAVAEIERENIIEQTMNGRKEKARQGGWNGGFAPYGYYLKDKQLFIQEDEAEAVRIIFDKYLNENMGFHKIANYLNLQGIQKIKRNNGTLSGWGTHFIRMIIDNPVYCGKISYGRRVREKVKGSKNEYKQIPQENYIIAEGQHEAIISEELWNAAHEKRELTGVKSPSKIGRDRAHLLSGILKCPKCGGPMYTNKHAWTNKDGTYKEIYYYVCSKARTARGKSCDYKAMLKKTDIEPLVIEAIRELIKNQDFAGEIKSRIGKEIDTSTLNRELKNYESKLREIELNKTRLENEIDSLAEDARFRERKIHDMTLRLDGLYDIIVELEEKIEDVLLRRKAVEQDAITLENIYTLLANFDKVYDKISDEEKKSLISSLIKEIEIFPCDEAELPLKSILFNFPVYKDGEDACEFLWDKSTHVSTCLKCVKNDMPSPMNTAFRFSIFDTKRFNPASFLIPSNSGELKFPPFNLLLLLWHLTYYYIAQPPALICKYPLPILAHDNPSPEFAPVIMIVFLLFIIACNPPILIEHTYVFG